MRLIAGGLFSVMAVVPLVSSALAASPATRVGPEFRANVTTILGQKAPAVVALSSGEFVVAWTDDSKQSSDTSGTAVRLRRFSHSGSPVSGELLMNTANSNDQKQVALARLQGGGFVGAWADGSFSKADKSGLAIHAQRFTNSAAKLSGQYQINSISSGDEDSPSLTSLPNGGFVAVYENSPATGGVLGQVLNAAGTHVGTEIKLGADTGREPAVAGLTGSSFLFVWSGLELGGPSRGSLSVFGQRFTAQGAKIGGEIAINTTKAGAQDNPSAAALLQGKSVVVWEDDSRTGGDASGLAVRGQILSSSGSKILGEFIVPTRRTGDQSQPVVASFPNGRFIVVWTDGSGSSDDPSGNAVRAQLYSAAGAKVGSEFKVNTSTNQDQEDPAVSVFSNTDFVVVWTDNNFLPFGENPPNIRGQVFHLTQ